MIINKKERLQACMDHLKYVEDSHNKLHFPPDSWLMEMITICDVTPRQTGATTAIADLFDVEHDLYVSFNYAAVSEFNRLLCDLGKANTKQPKKLKYIYLQSIPSDNEKLIKELADKLHITLPKNLKFECPPSIRGRHIDGIVWIDVGSFGMFQYHNVIYDMIKLLYAIYPHVKFIIT